MPPEFQKLYISSLRKQKHQTLLLVSDNASFPWELIRPNGLIETIDGSEEIDDPWMAVQFDLARWLLAHSPPATTIRLQRICCVATTSNVPGALEEVRYLENLAHVQGGTCDKPGSKDQLLGWLSTKPYDVVHFACHGKFLSEEPGESIILLPDGSTLSPGDLSDPAIQSMFSQSSPLVFMNSCHSGRTGSTLIGVGGWATKFIDQLCGAFIGCGWEVQSQLACDFAITFYDRLKDDGTLSEAIRDARQKIISDTNSTWLAYCLYGDPYCSLGK
jgi:CHAT domain